MVFELRICLSVFWSVNVCCRFFAIAFFLFPRIFSEGAAEVFSLFLGGKEMPQLIQAVTILIPKRRSFNLLVSGHVFTHHPKKVTNSQNCQVYPQAN